MENMNNEEMLNHIFSVMKNMCFEVSELKKKLTEDGVQVKKIYTNKTIKELLGIGDKTLQRYRDEGKLRFHQDKDKFWYTDEDVYEFLANNEVEPYAFEN